MQVRTECVPSLVLLRKTDICLQHRKLDILCVCEHSHWLITQQFHDSPGCAHCACSTTFIILHSQNYQNFYYFFLNMLELHVESIQPKNLQHPQIALCGNICVKSDIWYGKKPKGEGDRVYWRAGQTPWALVEAATGCLCLHIFTQKTSEMSANKSVAFENGRNLMKAPHSFTRTVRKPKGGVLLLKCCWVTNAKEICRRGTNGTGLNYPFGREPVQEERR